MSTPPPQFPSSTLAGDTSSKPPPTRNAVLADLNLDPHQPSFNFSSPLPINRSIVEEPVVDKMSSAGKETEVLDVEASQARKAGKFRSRAMKVDCSTECGGPDMDGDQNVQGVPSSREEKVSSLKTGLIHVARKMPKNAHAHFMLGLMYHRMGQPQKAILAYEKAAEILLRSEEEINRPELLSLVQLHHAQCLLLESLENCSLDNELEPEELDEIFSKMKESVQSDIRQASVWNILGLLLLRTGRLQSAISVLSSLLEIAPDNLDCLGNLGIAYLQGGNLELSEKCLQDLVLKDQNHPAALINYATLLLCRYGSVTAGAGASGDCKPPDQAEAANVAKECLLAAVKTDPRAAHLWTNLANAYYLTGDHRSSGKCLERAGKLEPNCLATRFSVAMQRIRDAEKSQNPNEQLTWAGNEMASVLREGDPVVIEAPTAWAGLAMVHKAQHEIAAVFDIEQNELLEIKERAMFSLKQAIGEDRGDAVQWHQIGLHCLCTQQFKTSQTYFKAAVARVKDCAYTWSNLGISLQLLEDTTQAEEVYKRALSLSSTEQAHATFSNLGNLYRQLKKYESAKAMFSKALQLHPGYAPAYNNLGLVFVAEGHFEQAKFCFNKATESDPLLDAAKSNAIKLAALCTGDMVFSGELGREGHEMTPYDDNDYVRRMFGLRSYNGTICDMHHQIG